MSRILVVDCFDFLFFVFLFCALCVFVSCVCCLSMYRATLSQSRVSCLLSGDELLCFITRDPTLYIHHVQDLHNTLTYSEQEIDIHKL